MCARREPRVTMSSRSQVRSAGNSLGVVVFLLSASALAGCGSDRDLILGTNEFVLTRRDEFDDLDLTYWELATHTFDDNLAWFTEKNAIAKDGYLWLGITQEQTPAIPEAGEVPKPYAAAELRTKAPFFYGRFRARVQMAPGVGVINAFWGFYDRYAAEDDIDNQIVTEGVSTPDNELRFNVVSPAAGPATETSKLAFDPAESFHVVAYDWTPNEVRFYVDGALHTAVTGDAVAALTEYQRLVLSAYPSRAGWVGDFDEAVLPVAAAYDWVEIYEYAGPRP
jgi:beta-glucanase (GH16 family)